MDRKTFSAMIMLLAGAILWGFSGLFSRTIMSGGFSPYDVTAIRMVLSTLILFVIVLIFDRSAFRLERRDILFFLFFGLMKLLSDLALFIAQSTVNLSLSTTLQMTSPVYVLIITVAVLGASATLKKVLGVVLSVVGCILVTGVLFDSSGDMAGILAALASGLCYGVYTIGAKMSLDRGYSPTGALFWMFVVSAVLSLFFGNPFGIMEASLHNVDILAASFGMAVLITLVPYWLQARSLEYVDTEAANVIGVTEAVVSALVGLVFYGEVLTFLNIVGMVLVFISIIIMGEETEREPPAPGEVAARDG